MLNLPKYYLISERPAKIDWTDKSHVGAFGFNWKTGEFEFDAKLYFRLTKSDNENVEEITEEEFDKKVEELRLKLRNATSSVD